MSVQIGAVRSMNDPDSETITPDDRQTLIAVVGGAVVQDYGYVQEGDKISWSLQFSPAAWEIVRGYWRNRTLVSITDAAGETLTAHIVIKSSSRVIRFAKYIKCQLEIWRV